MGSPVEIPYFIKIAGSVFLAFILFGIALVLIKKSKDKRQSASLERRRESHLAFPQKATLPQEALTATEGSAAEREQTIRGHYRHWLERYILPTYDARGAFMRVGVERKGLRYQVGTSSRGQALALFLSVLISGDDLSAPDRFERLLTFLVAHPSSQTEDLSTWYTFPDMSAPPKLEADPHAEAWIAYSLLMAEKQWQQGDLFNYNNVLHYRLSALSQLQSDIEASDHKRAIYAPLFFKAFAQYSDDAEVWNRIADELRQELLKHIKEAKFTLNGSAEEAWLAFSAWHFGMAGLHEKEDKHRKMANQFQSLVYEAVKTLPASLSREENDGLSPLAMLACCAPLAMLQNDQELVSRYWQVLSQHTAETRDAIGESLRLLALMTLNGNFWSLQ